MRKLLKTAFTIFCLLQLAVINAQDLKSIFDFGKRKGWATQKQEAKFNDYVQALNEKQKADLLKFLNGAKTPSARFFTLESLLAGDDFAVLQKFITELNKHNETYQQQRCLMINQKSIIQQWENTCSVTTLQTYLGDLCPRYAWEVKNIQNYDLLDKDLNNPMAQQQKALLEHYGGVVAKRGETNGKIIGILGPLNEWVGLMLGVKFYAQEVTEGLPNVFNKIRTQLDGGLNVPLLIGFNNSANKHFILVMKYINTSNGYQYLIYDPWDGVCNYVTESNLTRGSLAPLNNSWQINIQYYYPAVPLTAEEAKELYDRRNKAFGGKP